MPVARTSRTASTIASQVSSTGGRQPLDSPHSAFGPETRCPYRPDVKRATRKEASMSDFDRNYATVRGFGADRAVAIDQGLRAHMIRVYNYMAGGVALTGVVAWLTYLYAVSNPAFAQTLFSGPAIIVLMLAPLALVFFLSFRIGHMEVSTARALFFVYAGLLGLSLSVIFMAYTTASITRVFFITAASFGALSVWGYTTQRNLDGMGSFLMMGLFGLIIASLVNI